MTPVPIAFTRGVPPLEAVPVAELVRHTHEALAAEGGSMFQYAPIGGYRGDALLRELIARRHEEPDPDAVFVGNGSLQVLGLLAAHLLAGARSDVWVESPTYDRALLTFMRHGARIVPLPLEGDGLDVDAVRRLLARRTPAFLYTIPDFQNPSGVTLAGEKRRALADLAIAKGLRIVEDSPYRDLRFRGAAPPMLRELAPDQVFTVASLSKVLSPGLRIGYALADPATTRSLADMAANVYLSPAPLPQAVAARSLASGLVTRSTARACDLLRPRHDRAVAALRRELGDILVTVPDGGYFLGVQLPTSLGEDALLEAAASVGVALAPGSAFFAPSAPRPAGQLFVRLPFQALTPQRFADGVRRLRTVALPATKAPVNPRIEREEVIK